MCNTSYSDSEAFAVALHLNKVCRIFAMQPKRDTDYAMMSESALAVKC